MTFAVRSRGARSAREHGAESDGTAATLSSVSPRRVTNWASRSGIIWAAGSMSWGTRSLHRSTITSEHACAPPDWRKPQHFVRVICLVSGVREHTVSPCPWFCPYCDAALRAQERRSDRAMEPAGGDEASSAGSLGAVGSQEPQPAPGADRAGPSACGLRLPPPSRDVQEHLLHVLSPVAVEQVPRAAAIHDPALLQHQHVRAQPLHLR